MNSLKISRILVVLGLAIGMASWSYTVSHIGDPKYVLAPQFELGATHGWYHAFREAGGDIASMAAVLIIFFGPGNVRTSSTWTICLILMVGYCALFPVGMPYNPELYALCSAAELTHILMAVPTVVGLHLAQDLIFPKSDTKRKLVRLPPFWLDKIGTPA